MLLASRPHCVGNRAELPMHYAYTHHCLNKSVYIPLCMQKCPCPTRSYSGGATGSYFTLDNIGRQSSRLWQSIKATHVFASSCFFMQAVAEYSADAMRWALADAGDGLDDANFETTTANAAILRLTKELAWAEEGLAPASGREG